MQRNGFDFGSGTVKQSRKRTEKHSIHLQACLRFYWAVFPLVWQPYGAPWLDFLCPVKKQNQRPQKVRASSVPFNPVEYMMFIFNWIIL
jgi:hypothetical protein